MPIREVGFQLRDQSPQLVLEWDVNQKATFLADAAGDLDLTLTGGVFDLIASAPEFHISPDINVDAVIRANVSGAGLFQIDSPSAIDFSIVDTTVLQVLVAGVRVTGTFETTGNVTVGGILNASAGSFATPSHTFIDNLAAGMYLGNNRLAFGATQWSFGSDWEDNVGTGVDQFQIGDFSAGFGLMFKTSGVGYIVNSVDSVTFGSRVALGVGEIVFATPATTLTVSSTAITSVVNILPSVTDSVNLGLSGTEWRNLFVSRAVTAATLTLTGTGSFTNPLRAPDGTNLLPSYAFTNDFDTGMYLATTAQLAFSVSGAIQARIDVAGFLFWQRMKSVSDGAPATPVYSFNNSQAAGMYLISTNVVGFSAASGVKLEVNATNVRSHVNHLFAGGTITTPGIAFTSQPVMGFRLRGTSFIALELEGTGPNAIGFSTATGFTDILLDGVNGDFAGGDYFQLRATNDPSFKILQGGTERVDITGTTFTVTGQLTASNRMAAGDGTTGFASYGFLSATNTGMYRDGSGRLVFVQGGGERIFISNTVQFNATAFPGLDSTYDLGTSSLRWRNVYADAFIGNGGVGFQIIAAGSVTWTSTASLAAHASRNQDQSVTGVLAGDTVIVAQDHMNQNGLMLFQAFVFSSNSVRFVLANNSPGALSPSNRTIDFFVLRRT